MAGYVNVQLKTRPSKSIMIPKGYEEKARQLIDIAINNPENLLHQITLINFDEHPYLKNPGLLSRVVDLATEDNPVKANELQDIILLRIGIYANTPLISSSDSEERKKALEVDSDLIRIVKDLEGNR